jgi:hypothetical protein
MITLRLGKQQPKIQAIYIKAEQDTTIQETDEENSTTLVIAGSSSPGASKISPQTPPPRTAKA